MAVDSKDIEQLVLKVTQHWRVFRARKQGKSVCQIARQLGLPESTVRRSSKRSSMWK